MKTSTLLKSVKKILLAYLVYIASVTRGDVRIPKIPHTINSVQASNSYAVRNEETNTNINKYTHTYVVIYIHKPLIKTMYSFFEQSCNKNIITRLLIPGSIA